MLRSLSFSGLLLLLLNLHSAYAVDREWDGEGSTLNWSEAANWSDDGVPDTTDDTFIGSLPVAFDTTVILDVNADRVRSLVLENGADLDLDGARLLMDVDGTIGAGAALGTSVSELIVHKRIGTGGGQIAIDANSMLVGANGKLTLVDGGEFELDGTGVMPGTLTVADGGEVHGHGVVLLTDTDASLGSVSSLIQNEGLIIVEDPLFMGIGEPTAVQLQITAPNAPTFAQIDFAGSSNTGIVSLARNSSLHLDTPYLAPSTLSFEANSTLTMQQAGTFADGQTIEVNSGILNPGGVNELPAVPAVINGDGLLSSSAIIRINQVTEELIVETPFDGVGGLVMNRGILKFRGGGNLRAIEIDDLDLGKVVNESADPLEFQGGQTYETQLDNTGQMSVAEFDGEATVGLKSFVQTDLGSLSLDIGGELVGDYDQLSTTDDITLDGSLEVLLADMFDPSAGSVFTILTSQSGSVNGQFATLNLPTLDGRDFEVVYNASSVELQVIATATPGDFDGDGDVDGSDFLLWQRDNNIGDLADWQLNYGTAAPAASVAAVPEPSTTIGAVLALTALLLGRRI